MHKSIIKDSIPRHTLLNEPTPIQRLDRMEQLLGADRRGVNLFIKRDDHGLIGGGGNKLRKLEFLLGQAIAEGADTVITTGGLQSNHARLTAAAAAKSGLNCELVLTRLVPRSDDDYELSGNVMLDQLFGATMHVYPGTADARALAEQRAEGLRRMGRRVYVIPGGGSSALGALGYVRCAEEIMAQEIDMGVEFAQVMLPNGSAGTHAGLCVGFDRANRSPNMVRSFAVLADEVEAISKTLALSNATLDLLGIDQRIDKLGINVDGSHRGEGYGIPTEEMKAAVRLLARSEGILLDPVYSGKAFAGMLADVRAGRFAKGQNVLFLMTGGTPGLFAYRSSF